MINTERSEMVGEGEVFSAIVGEDSGDGVVEFVLNE